MDSVENDINQQRVQHARRGIRELAARTSTVDPGHRSILLSHPDNPLPPPQTTATAVTSADSEFDEIVDRFFNRLETLLAERNSRRSDQDLSRPFVSATSPAWQSLIRAHAQIRSQLPPADEDSGVTMHGRTVAHRLSAAAAVSELSDHPSDLDPQPSTSRHPQRPALERLQLPVSGSAVFTHSERPLPPAFRSARNSRTDSNHRSSTSSSGRLSLLSNHSMFNNFATPTSSVVRDQSMLFDEPTSFITTEPERRRSSLIPPEAIEGRGYTLIRRLDEQGQEVVSQLTFPPEPTLAGGSRRHRPVNDPLLRRRTNAIELERVQRHFDPHTRLVLEYDSEDEMEDPRVRLPCEDGFGNFEISREKMDEEEVLFIGSSKPFKANPLPLPLPDLNDPKPAPRRPPFIVSRQSSLVAR